MGSCVFEQGKMTRQGVTLKDVSAADFIDAYAAHLKRSGKVELPTWHNVVRTGHFKELAPYDEDWYYVRAASIARKVYLRQKTGVGALTKVYGGADRRGTKPSHFTTSSSKIVRHICQQLETMKPPDGGRVITDEGQRALDSIACSLINKGDEADEWLHSRRISSPARTHVLVCAFDYAGATVRLCADHLRTPASFRTHDVL